MRWKRKKPKYPKDGDTYITNKFLFFPKCINSEWRWLEKAKIKRQYSVKVVDIKIDGWIAQGWKDIGWIDDE